MTSLHSSSSYRTNELSGSWVPHTFELSETTEYFKNIFSVAILGTSQYILSPAPLKVTVPLFVLIEPETIEKPGSIVVVKNFSPGNCMAA